MATSGKENNKMRQFLIKNGRSEEDVNKLGHLDLWFEYDNFYNVFDKYNTFKVKEIGQNVLEISKKAVKEKPNSLYEIYLDDFHPFGFVRNNDRTNNMEILRLSPTDKSFAAFNRLLNQLAARCNMDEKKYALAKIIAYNIGRGNIVNQASGYYLFGNYYQHPMNILIAAEKQNTKINFNDINARISGTDANYIYKAFKEVYNGK
ncbi:MAG: hypothetical protein LBK26_04510 [Rickettsiales bacterium]|jgi:hypothetical protein|nr:hypothetical protein [Rickettsiales bacterium]